MPESNGDSTSVEIMGFDIGHGETALAKTSSSATTEPQMVEVKGKRNFITAVAKHPEKGVLIGEEAYATRNLEGLTVGFKSENLDQRKVREPLKMFVRKVLDCLLEGHQIQGDERSHFVVGVPSGWKEDIREKYAAVLREAGLKDVTLTKESRAAFIQAKESQDIRLTSKQLQGSVLIIDIGSSTTDFTTVVNMRESLKDFGNTSLGASLLDKAILERVIASYEPPEQRERLRNIVEGEPQWAAKCELTCRRAKEKYFSEEPEHADEVVEDILRIPAKPTMYFTVGLARKDMEEILSSPLLGGLNWPDAFRQELMAAKERMKHELPDTVLLTGGASRMDFCLKYCKEVFPTARVVRGTEPQFSIAKGLAWAGRIDKKDQAFRQEVEDLLASDELRKAVDKELPALLESVANALTSLLIDRFVLPALQEWREGKIITLADLEPTIQSRFSTWLKRKEGQDYVIKLILQWFKKVGPKLKELTDPICRTYGIPSKALSLESGETIGNETRVRSINTGGLVPAGDFLGVVAMYVAGLITMAIGVSMIHGAVISGFTPAAPVAMALTVTLLAVSVAIGVVGGVKTRNRVQGAMQSANIPGWMRKLVSQSRIEETLNENKPEIEAAILSSLAEPKVKGKMLDEITDAVRHELRTAAESVIIFIR